jgi:hypothetical protein
MRLAVGLVLCASLASAGDRVRVRPPWENERFSSKPRLELVKQIASLQGVERGDLRQYLEKERIDVRTELIRCFEETPDDETRFTVAYLLGYFRMSEAVPILSKRITLDAGYPDSWAPGGRVPWTQYPVAEALISIGNPSIRAMMDNIRTTDDDNVRKLSVRVIRYIEGPEIGRVILQRDFEKQTDANSKARLQAAIIAFDELVKATS